MKKKEKLVFATNPKTTKKAHENAANTDIYFGEPVKKEENKLEFNMPSKKKKENNQLTFSASSKKKKENNQLTFSASSKKKNNIS